MQKNNNVDCVVFTGKKYLYFFRKNVGNGEKNQVKNYLFKTKFSIRFQLNFCHFKLWIKYLLHIEINTFSSLSTHITVFFRIKAPNKVLVTEKNSVGNGESTLLFKLTFLHTYI